MPFGWEVKFVVLNHLNWWRLIKMDLNILVSSATLFFTLLFQKNSDVIIKFEIQSHFCWTQKRLCNWIDKIMILWTINTKTCIYLYSDPCKKSPIDWPSPLRSVVTGEICFASCWPEQHRGEYKSKQRKGIVKSSHPIYLLDSSPCPCAIAATNDLNAIKLFLFHKLSLMCIKLCGCW